MEDPRGTEEEVGETWALSSSTIGITTGEPPSDQRNAITRLTSRAPRAASAVLLAAGLCWMAAPWGGFGGRAGLAGLPEATESVPGEVLSLVDTHSAVLEERPPAAVPGMGSGFPHKAFAPTLFCFSVMQPDSYEELLIKHQLKHRTSIFACDDFAVLSPKRKFLGYGHQMPNGSWVAVYSWYNPAPEAAFGVFGSGDATNSFKNTGAFMEAWDTLTKSAVFLGHDWIAKVDPDAVFFAYRLRWHVKKFPASKPIYFKNCASKPGWPDGDYLFGALEVFSSAATSAYFERGTACKSLPWGGWGEDLWISRCMEALGADVRLDDELVGDRRCVDVPCTDAWRAAFHDYKSVAAWDSCWHKSMNAEAALDDAKRNGRFCCHGKDPCGNCSRRQYPGEDLCTSPANCGWCGIQSGGCSAGKSMHGTELLK